MNIRSVFRLARVKEIVLGQAFAGQNRRDWRRGRCIRCRAHRQVNQLDALAIGRVEIARILFGGVAVPMFMDAQAGDHFPALLVNRARRRVIRLRHFKEIIVGVGADQNARMAVRVVVVFGLREQNIQPDGIQRHAVHRGQHARRPVGIFVRLDAVVERRIRKMQRIGAPLAPAVKSVEHKQNRLRAEIGRGRQIHDAANRRS